MYFSKITSKGQTTIPKEVRKKLQAEPGDSLAYQIQENGSVMVSKIAPFDFAWHAALSQTLAAEWNSPEADEAFRDL